MRISRSAVVVFAGLVLVGLVVRFGVSEEGRANRKPKPAPQRIAMIDTQAVFNSLPKVQQLKEALQGEVKQADALVKREQAEIKAMQDLLQGVTPGSEEYVQTEKQVAQRLSDLNLNVALQRKDFIKQEAEIYVKIHDEMHAEIRRYAKQNRIAAVFKLERSQPNASTPDSVVRALNRQIVFCEDELDITPIILQRLKERHEKEG